MLSICRRAVLQLNSWNYLRSPYEFSWRPTRPRENSYRETSSCAVFGQRRPAFFGFCSYFRRFVMNFADIARSLTQLLKQENTFSWGPEQADAFRTFTRLLTTTPILAHFGPTAPTEVQPTLLLSPSHFWWSCGVPTRYNGAPQ